MKLVLILDSVINFILGILLFLGTTYPKTIPNFFGVPGISNPFYPSILGGIFIGIGFALIIEAYRKNSGRMVGLGLSGAISINLCGGIVLFVLLLFGQLDLPIRGLVFLWSLALILIGISVLELVVQVNKNNV